MKYEHDLGNRAIAYIIDSLVIGVFSNLFSGITKIGGNIWFSFSLRNLSDFWDEGMWFLLYFVLFAFFNKGITIGKMATNQVVLTGDKDEVSTTNLIIRESIKVVLLPIIFINFLIVAFREDNRSIHDMLTDTVVVQAIKGKPSQFEKETKQSQERDDYYN
jgi:uncharacterized RDD family membrane protein YckC